jgi:pimeloyl-ACP methyl ester carboxylesterase
MHVVACAASDALAALLLLAGLFATTGCHRQTQYDWSALLVADGCRVVDLPDDELAGHVAGLLAKGQQHLDAADQLDREGNPACVDEFYHAALVTWPLIEIYGGSVVDSASQSAWQVYQQSVAGLIEAGIRYGRLDPRGQLIIGEGPGRCVVPIAYHGFPLPPREFCELHAADKFPRNDLARYYESPGIGATLVAIRQTCNEQPFYPPKQHFAVTAVLRPTGAYKSTVLDFYNPRVFDSLSVGTEPVPLNRNLSAPFAALLEDTPRKFTEGFIDPNDANVQPRLFMLEPYQRGKIPVVFIHGLWSDPVTWTDTVNDLQAQTDIQQQYQFWFFRYPTGRGMLESAAELREQLQWARATIDPNQQDPSLDNIVMVGHSMGGLIAKLQVTHSYDIVWRHAASQPLQAVRAPEFARRRLQRMFFFEPSPSITRVVSIGTPFRGSGLSRRVIGRAASKLVRTPLPEKIMYRKMMEANRDIFAEFLWDSWPTSVDLLEPDNPLLAALSELPYREGVRQHTIIGTGGPEYASEPSDGVVPVSSARMAGVCSETFVNARHAELHSDPATVNQLACILRQHADKPPAQ